MQFLIAERVSCLLCFAKEVDSISTEGTQLLRVYWKFIDASSNLHFMDVDDGYFYWYIVCKWIYCFLNQGLFHR